MNRVAIVPCKASSVRVPNKNLRMVGGMPLWLRKARQLKRSGLFDEVWVDTDSEAIAHDARAHGFCVMMREPKVNGFDGNELFAWEVCRVPKADVYVQALCTAPFVGDCAIAECIKLVEAGADTACVVEKRRDYRAGDWVNTIPASDELRPFIRDCMSVYAVGGEYARRTGMRVGGVARWVEVEGIEALDVDWPGDLVMAQLIGEGLRSEESRGFKALEKVVGSSLMSDVLEEMGLEEYAIELAHCPMERRIGRACTLKLVPEGSDEAVDDIYGALDHYDWCSPGDMLMVGNGAVHAAYFGELNSLLGERAGARGCVVERATRDSMDTVLPVWSDYRMSSDCRDVLALGGIGVPIEMQGVVIEHGDLIVADADGVIVVPWEIERDAIVKALGRAENEARIKIGVAHGLSADELISAAGRF